MVKNVSSLTCAPWGDADGHTEGAAATRCGSAQRAGGTPAPAAHAGASGTRLHRNEEVTLLLEVLVHAERLEDDVE